MARGYAPRYALLPIVPEPKNQKNQKFITKINSQHVVFIGQVPNNGLDLNYGDVGMYSAAANGIGCSSIDIARVCQGACWTRATAATWKGQSHFALLPLLWEV